jgi:hypothetical protein
MILEQTISDAPQQNGILEQSRRVILQRARVMRIQSKLPKILWPELVKTTVYILNRTLRKALN